MSITGRTSPPMAPSPTTAAPTTSGKVYVRNIFMRGGSHLYDYLVNGGRSWKTSKYVGKKQWMLASKSSKGKGKTWSSKSKGKKWSKNNIFQGK
jgi:hypothetical protein